MLLSVQKGKPQYIIVNLARRPAVIPTLIEAEVNNKLGNYKRAEELWLNAASLCTSSDDAIHGILMNRLGSSKLAQRDYSSALQFFTKNATSARRGHGENSAQFATAQDNLSTVYAALQQYDEARITASEATRIRKTLSPTGPDLADSYRNLAALCLLQRDYLQAKSYAKFAVAIALKHGEGNVKSADSMRLLTLVFLKENSLREAKKMCLRTRKIEKSLQLCNTATIQTLGMLAEISVGLGEFQEALLFYEQAIKDSEQIHASQSETIQTYRAKLENLRKQLSPTE